VDKQIICFFILPAKNLVHNSITHFITHFGSNFSDNILMLPDACAQAFKALAWPAVLAYKAMNI
jgi:hypothetical protein